MRNNLDLSGLRRSTIGFDRLFDLLEHNHPLQGADSYPPFDLEHDGEDHYRITLAVAGFRRDEIEITAHQNLLVITGMREERREEAHFLHRAIARRNFERRFELADFVQVRGADLKDGLLVIDLVREVPEALRPRKIDIGGRIHQLDPASDREDDPARSAA